MVNCKLCRHHLLPFTGFVSDAYWGRAENLHNYTLQVKGAIEKRSVEEQKTFRMEATYYCNACKSVFWCRQEKQTTYYDCLTKLSIAAR